MSETPKTINDKDIPNFITSDGMMAAVEAAILAEHHGEIQTFSPSVIVTPGGKFVFKGALDPEHVLYRNVSLVPGNAERGIDKIQGGMTFAEANTGRVLASFIGNRNFTGHRTGAAGGAIARHLFSAEVAQVLIFGSGDEAIFQYDYLAAALASQASSVRHAVAEVFVYSLRRENAERCAAEQSKRHRLTKFTAINKDDIEHVCADSDVIMTTTPSQTPLLNASWVRPGTHITAVGADMPGKRELPTELLEDADVTVVVDNLSDSKTRGILQGSSRGGRVYEAWEILENGVPESKGKTSIWGFSGRGAWDLGAARYVYSQMI